ncbi:MAG: TrkH family potassium uptake protein [bacterium]
MFTPLLILPFNSSEIRHIWNFLVPGTIQNLAGLLLWRLFGRKTDDSISLHEGGVIVIVSWIIVLIVSAIPFLTISQLGFSGSVFESVSGWTTTGLSVLDVSKAAKMILLWRSIIQFAGGAGLAIIMMSSIISPAGVAISSAEGRGDQLVPHVRQSARLVLIIYLSYAFLGILLYKLTGMNLFDAVNHSFTAVSTGGFSTKISSIGYWNSIPIESVTILLMILGSTSFLTAWMLLRGKFRAVINNGEIRILSIIIPLSIVTLFVFTCKPIYLQLSKALRVGFFESLAAITTTGFSTVTYTDWNSYGFMLLIILMLMGGGIFSTAGGIKQFRIYLLWKLAKWEIKRNIMPKYTVLECSIWEGERQVFLDNRRIRQVGLFISLYISTYLLGSLILCANGFSLNDSLFEFASAIGTVGLSVGVTSLNMPVMALWAEIIAMFLGRLEFVVIIVSFYKILKDSRCMLSRTEN